MSAQRRQPFPFFQHDFSTWFFDLDDTLMWNSTTYNQPVIDFVKYLTKIFNNRIPSMGTIARIQEDIDYSLGNQINPRTGNPYAFGSDRFPDSFAFTYRALCEKGFGVFDKEVANQCREIGKTAFDERNYHRLGLVPGAKELLDFLARWRHLVLVTKGEQEVQEAKIKALSLERWFHDIRIVDQKSWRVYHDVLASLRSRAGKRAGEYSTAKTVAIGNSYSSDIAPAIELGMHAIFIPCPTWKAESVDIGDLTEEARTRLQVFENIGQVLPWIKGANT